MRDKQFVFVCRSFRLFTWAKLRPLGRNNERTKNNKADGDEELCMHAIFSSCMHFFSLNKCDTSSSSREQREDSDIQNANTKLNTIRKWIVGKIHTHLSIRTVCMEVPEQRKQSTPVGICWNRSNSSSSADDDAVINSRKPNITERRMLFAVWREKDTAWRDEKWKKKKQAHTRWNEKGHSNV